LRLAAQGMSVRLGQRLVLDGLDVAAEAGEIIAVIGPNGAGKSTLLKSLAGLVPLENGRVMLDGEEVARMDACARGRRIAFIPQDRTI
jgi:iron complex transport system ATP-binding protein